ncbi:ABC transporter permease subunit [Fusibacter sp. 3D3]|uniref:ABC transporter permease n=1 Tax=Fusibacter sp. 3D3 TaxID=1048380 RepID=UPI000853E03D|nr:ABC transporter permease [Fusibacter sp. 3D3]GAU79568.1 ABC transporter permease protein [Fusibacter sp. 3D3]
MNKTKLKSKYLILMMLPFFILVIAFELLPALFIVINAFLDQASKLTLDNFKVALTDPFYLQGMKNSLLISISSSFVGIVISIISVQAIQSLTAKNAERVIMLSNMTANFAGVPLAFAFMILLGNNGVFTILMDRLGLGVFDTFNLYSGAGLTLVYVYFQVPLGILLMYPAFDGIKPQWKEAASNLGASTLAFWRHIGIPVLMPSIVATFSIMFANAMGAYATAYALTTSNYNLMSVRIGALISGDMFLNPNLASAVAMVLGALMFICNYTSERMTKRRGVNEIK